MADGVRRRRAVRYGRVVGEGDGGRAIRVNLLRDAVERIIGIGGGNSARIFPRGALFGRPLAEFSFRMRMS